MDVNLNPRAAPVNWRGRAGWQRIYQNVAALRTDGQGPHGRPQGEHSNIKTKRRFLPNLCNVTFISDALGRNVRLRVSTNAIKSVDHRGASMPSC